MSDRHLCKGKRTDNGEWVEGFLIEDDFGCFIVPEDYISERQLKNKSYGYELILIKAFEVDSSTICQCTGLKDKNGELIWENDICIIHDSAIDEEDGYFTVEWDDDGARFALEGDGLTADFDSYHGYECEVIGSAIDNPELLEVQDE